MVPGVAEAPHAGRGQRPWEPLDILRSKDLFREQVLAHAPLVRSIWETLKQKKDGTMGAEFFLDVLDERYLLAEAQRQFATAVDWGRYAELFGYDADAERLRLPAPDTAGTARTSA